MCPVIAANASLSTTRSTFAPPTVSATATTTTAAARPAPSPARIPAGAPAAGYQSAGEPGAAADAHPATASADAAPVVGFHDAVAGHGVR